MQKNAWMDRGVEGGHVYLGTSKTSRRIKLSGCWFSLAWDNGCTGIRIVLRQVDILYRLTQDLTPAFLLQKSLGS